MRRTLRLALIAGGVLVLSLVLLRSTIRDAVVSGLLLVQVAAYLYSFEHVQPDFPRLGPRTLFSVYLPEGSKIFRVIFDLLQQGH